uniref:Galectin domain-containing protein n=1 Tax=Globodera pallida TaxID=36090 RepID=A0A183C5C2_GLOPA
MLICYPSTVATHPLGTEHIINGMSVNSELFNVDGNVKNSLAKECKELLIGFSNKKYQDKAFWHGIKVYTVRKSDGTIAMKLSTSLVGQEHGHSFEIPQAQRQFIIHFGNERELFTYVTIDGGEPVEVEGEKAKREAYKQLAPRGARLKDFVGFWTLGLDVLPWMNHTMRLHVERSCDCVMEAWNNKLEANHLIHIRMLTSKYTRNVTFKLFTSGWKAHKALMSFFISCNGGVVFMRAARERHVNGGFYFDDDDHLDCGKNQSTQLEFRIALTKYSYGIVMGRLKNNKYHLKRLYGEEFFPLNWWQGLPFDLMDHYKLSGEFMLLNDPPPVMPFKNIEKNYKPKMQTDRFNTFPVDNLLDGTLLTFRVRPHNPKNYTFNISLLHNRPEEHPTIGKTVLKIQVYPNRLRLSSSFVEDKEIKDRFTDVPHNIERDLLELNITVLRDGYKFIINGEFVNSTKLNYFSYPAVLPLWATNNVRIEGKIDQLGPPRVNMPRFRYSLGANIRRGFTKFTKKLRSLLNYNDTITIEVEVYNTSKYFAIYLMDESLEPSKKIGHVVLALYFTVDKATLTQCGYHLHQNGLDEMESNGSDFPNMTSFGYPVDNRLNPNGQKFIITIKCEEKHFAISLDEVDFVELKCPYPTIEKNDVTMPPWAVDHIQIVGEVYVYTLEITQPEISTPQFWMGVDHTEAVLQPGDLINVKINKTLGEERDFNVTVNLFYEALQFHKKVGKTVMNMTFIYKKKNGTLYFTSYDNGLKGSKLCYNNTLDMTLASQELDFDIEVILNKTTNTTGFEVTLNDVYMYTYMDGLPAWAVHYITICTVFESRDL